MKQITQNYKTGQIRVADVEPPLLKQGGVLVQTQYSVISSGTEGMKVREGKMSYLGKARARPDQVKKVLQSVQQQGLASTYRKVMNKLDSLTPLGYSLSGVVMAVGPGAEEFQVGQHVACAGAGYANHAEINFVPKNLVVPVPNNVAMEHAAFATIGAISMQGFRQAEMQLGETACVIGLGLLGQLLVQLLKAAGIGVVGIDIVEERCKLAQDLGAKLALKPDDPGLLQSVAKITNGFGVDCVFIAAGGNSNSPVELAVELARDRGRVVDIGKTKLDLSWNDYYEKELDVRFSRSYGPGRYDRNYEEKGIDYPIGYVRWTERRNMSSFLDLISEGCIVLDKIVSDIRPFADAEKVYQELAEGSTSGLGVVFRHSDQILNKRLRPSIRVKGSGVVARDNDGKVRIGMIGAGNYASSMLLPHLAGNDHVHLVEVATATSLSATNAARKFGFKRVGTDYKELLEAMDIDAIMITTQHATHARMAAEALRKGKTVYVEKPLAIDLDGVELIRKAAVESGNDRLMVGFNRRFSPLVKELKYVFSHRSSPLVMYYRVHAGQLEVGSWYLDVSSHGSRFVGEAAHFFDVFAFITGARPVSVMAKALRPQKITNDDLENLVVMVDYDDGSVATLMYLTQGGAKVPKEYLEVFGGGRTAQLFNFEFLRIFEGNDDRKIKPRALDKGQKDEMKDFVTAVCDGSEMPISFDCILDTTLVTLSASQSLRTGQPVYLDDYWQPLAVLREQSATIV